MKPGYDFSIASGEELNIQCTVSNPDSLIDVNDGNLIMRKDGSSLAGFVIFKKNKCFYILILIYQFYFVRFPFVLYYVRNLFCFTRY